MPSVEDKILKARTQLLIEQPFFGTLALKLRLINDDESCDTAATDGKRLVYNSSFVDKLTAQELRGLIAHEVMHCVFNHMTRRQDRDPDRWNVACDYAINEHLIKTGFILPHGGCIDHRGDYTGMTAEAIYNMLPEDTKTPLWGLVMDNGSGTMSNGSAALEADWQVSVNQAAEIAKSKGKMPGHLKEAIKYILDPVIDWRSVLWPFFTSLCSDDYSWRKPNRAYISEDEYLPSMRDETAGTVVICIDSSGSISDTELQQFWSEVVAVAKEVRPAKIICVVCDSKVQNVYEWADVDMLWDEPPEITGRGGTAFSPAFEAVDELHEEIDALVYLTDLECSDFPEQPHYPVLWISTKDTKAPWGETIYMQVQ